ncbi:alpha/beta hydrolase [Roseibium sp. HPY-6]|uniref:alpha/beta hydrolase n=1 Tax=Roseibium sp. HPY-6 TaxID=3229852 RepID=UPI00338EDF34
MTSTSHDDTSNQAVQNAQTRTVTFEVKGAPLSGTLYLPKGFDGKPRAVVVVTGAWTAVEEQMPANYARELVKHGLAALTFDFRGWGKSGDLEDGARFVENPAAKTADIRAAFECVAALPEVDAARIFGLGICASAGYMVDAVAGNPLVSRIALIAPWLQDKDIVNAVYGGDEGVAALIETSRKAEAAGGEIIPAAGPVGADGVLMPVGGYYYEAQRGAIPQYDNKWNNAGWEGWLTYYPADNPGRLDKPLAVVHSQSAAIPEGARKFLEGYGNAAKTLWLEDVEQFDFYDAPANISRATDFVARHCQSDLA